MQYSYTFNHHERKKCRDHKTQGNPYFPNPRTPKRKKKDKTPEKGDGIRREVEADECERPLAGIIYCFLDCDFKVGGGIVVGLRLSRKEQENAGHDFPLDIDS